MASHRTSTFIRQQSDFLCRPFPELSPDAQAFSLGFLCHLCVDEVSKSMWGRRTWLKFRAVGPGPAFAALDEIARDRIVDYPAIVGCLGRIKVLDIVPSIPYGDVEATWQGVNNFVRAETAEDEYLALVDMFDNITAEERAERQRVFRATIDSARRQVHFFRFETLIKASLKRSRLRLRELITGQSPEPGKPDLN